jgi:hypothetical protein
LRQFRAAETSLLLARDFPSTIWLVKQLLLSCKQKQQQQQPAALCGCLVGIL